MDRPTRRDVLAVASSLGLAGVAGCPDRAAPPGGGGEMTESIGSSATEDGHLVDPEDHGGDVGAALNAARADGHWGNDTLLNVAPGRWLCSTVIDWTAQGAAGVISGPDVDLRGVEIDPDVGAGNFVIEQVGVRDMGVYGGEIENHNGSGCAGALVQARNAAGARPRENNYYATQFDDPDGGNGHLIASYVNVGCPNSGFEDCLFRALGPAMHLTGTNDPDGLTLTHDDIDASPADSAIMSFHNCNFSNHGGPAGDHVIQMGGSIQGTYFSGQTYVQTNVDSAEGFRLIDGGDTMKSVVWDLLQPEAVGGTGFDAIFYLPTGMTQEIEGWTMNVHGGTMDADGKFFKQKEGAHDIRHCTFGPTFRVAKGLELDGAIWNSSIAGSRLARMGETIVSGTGDRRNLTLYGGSPSHVTQSGTDYGTNYWSDGDDTFVMTQAQGRVEIDASENRISLGTGSSYITYNGTNGDIEIYADDGTQQL